MDRLRGVEANAVENAVNDIEPEITFDNFLIETAKAPGTTANSAPLTTAEQAEARALNNLPTIDPEMIDVARDIPPGDDGVANPAMAYPNHAPDPITRHGDGYAEANYLVATPSLPKPTPTRPNTGNAPGGVFSKIKSWFN